MTVDPASSIPVNGLMGYWSFDNGTAADNSGRGLNGTLVNSPAIVAGKAGQAVSLNGLSQYVDVGNVLNPGSGDLSIFAWIKTTQPGGLNMLLSKRNSSATSNSGYQLFQNSSGSLSFTFSDGASSRVRVDASAPKVNDGNWHSVGVTFTRSGNGVIYVDGTPATGGTGSITSQPGFVTNSAALRFGLEDQTGGGFYSSGSIDEVRIYNRALSLQEITAIAAGGGQAASPLAINSLSLASGAVNVPYTPQTLAASGGTAPYNWSLASGVLPAGLSLATAGTISGTPTAPGTSSFTVQVKDNALTSATQQLAITINPASLSVTTNSLPNGTVNLAYPAQTLNASGGISPYTWSVLSGSLPAGLLLSSSGIISGTPNTPATSNFTIQVKDSALVTATQAFTATINPTALLISTSTLPNGTINTAYGPQNLTASGGVQPYTWSLASGSLPAGLSISSSGAITGTPTATGISSFSVQVRDNVLVTATQALNLTVTASGPTLTATASTIAPGGTQTATWNGVSNPMPRDWIGLYTPGSSDGSFLNWVYVSCTRSPGSALASGSCPFTIPGSVANGNYELRLFSNDGFTRLATSNQFFVGTLPVVTVIASAPAAAEGGAAARFTVTRSGSTTTSLTVSYSLGGTATNGTDYSALTGNVVIPANTATANVDVVAIDDASVEGSETVLLTLVGNSAYVIGTPNTATVTITDNDFIPTLSITGGTFTYDGNSHPATAFAYGVAGVADVLSPPATLAYQGIGTTSYGPTAIPPANSGTYQATATFAGNANYQSISNTASLTIVQASASLNLANLNQTFDGTAKPVAVVTIPSGLSGITVTYNGGALPPSNAGSYSVVATLTNANYTAPTANGNLTVARATPSVSVTGGAFSYDGSSHGASGFAYGVGGTSDVLTPAVALSYQGTGATVYGPTATAPASVGTYSASATFSGNANYGSGSSSAVIAISDTTAPDTSITSGPTGSVTVNTASFNWTGNDNLTGTASLQYAFRLDPIEPAFSTFSTATVKSYSSLANGSYTFIVKARDAAGKEDPTPATRAFTVGIPSGATLSATPSIVAPGTAVTATWNGIGNPTAADWIGLYSLGSADASFLTWDYVNCTRSPGSAIAAGSCPLAIPNALPNGNYELRLFTNDGFTRLAVSNTFVIGIATPMVTLNFDGKIRDRVSQREFGLVPDGQQDGVFTLAFVAGSTNRTVSRIQMNRAGNVGVWNTVPGDGFWSLGAATILDGLLLNSADDTVNFAVADGSAVKLFAADFQGQMFIPGSTFTVTINFADGTSAAATVTLN